jgi:hypothetical protein
MARRMLIRQSGVATDLSGTSESATHERGMVGHLLMGNVAEKVVRIAPCPVLAMHHPEHEFIQPDALQAVGAAGKSSAA